MTNDNLFYSLGLIGYPLEHSLSPRLHGAALSAMQMSGEYQLYPIPPFPQGERELAELLARLRRGGLHGLNVTIPHKQNVIHYLDVLSPAAQAIGAANTLWMQNGALRGDNTDAPGFISDLERIIAGVLRQDESNVLGAGRHALILGAGGSARAVVYALLESGWRVTVAARRLEQAHELASSFQSSADSEQGPTISSQSSVVSGRLTAVELKRSAIGNLQPEIDLLVNTTPVGMWPDVEANPWPKGAPFPQGAFVYDLVYNPPETALLRAARRAGLGAANGLGMLIEQAALALEHWTGVAVPRFPMWQAVPEFQDRFSAWGAATQFADCTQKEYE